MKAMTITKDGKTYRRLKRGDIIRANDWQWTCDGEEEYMNPGAFPAQADIIGERVQLGKMEGYRNDFWREVTAEETTTKPKKHKAK